MNIFDAIILGLVQGLTEFLPISSSGHLVICQFLLGIKEPDIGMAVWLHFGTLLAVIAFYRSRIIEIIKSVMGSPAQPESDRKMVMALIIGTIPAAVIGLLFESNISEMFGSPRFASMMLLVTGLILLSTKWMSNRGVKVSIKRGGIIGLAQAFAILPGISRSGSTIGCAMLMGIEPAKAAEFSFLLSIPVIGGAFLIDLVRSFEKLLYSGDIVIYLVGLTVSGAVGYVSIHYLLKIIRRGRLFFFGFYCLVVGTVSLIFIG